MRKISMVVLTGLLGCSALAAAAVPPTAVPQSPAAQSATVQTDLPWLPAEARTATADPLESLFPHQQVCLCIMGDHCCVIHGKQTCVPNSQPCP